MFWSQFIFAIGFLFFGVAVTLLITDIKKHGL